MLSPFKLNSGSLCCALWAAAVASPAGWVHAAAPSAAPVAIEQAAAARLEAPVLAAAGQAAAHSAAAPAATGQAAVHPAASPAITGQAAVEKAAREHLLALAARTGLADARVSVSVVPRASAPARCTGVPAVEALDTRNVTRMRFAVTCPGSPELRTEFVARGTITANIVVAAADIVANRPIAEAQLTRERRDVPAAADATSDIDAVTGQASRRAIRAGQVIATRWLVQPVLVRRGSAVDIVAHNAGIEVRVAGEALENGRRSEIVRVRNVRNGNVITARVIDEHTVEPAVGSAQ